MNSIDYSFLSQTTLFKGISETDIQNALPCLSAKVQSYKKNEVIYHTGDKITSLGIILSGSVSLESDDIWGNTSIIDSLHRGQVFAETYATIPNKPILINVVALEQTNILFINVDRILNPCEKLCSHHQKLIRNMLMVSAQKNINLSQKIFHCSPKSIRGKLLSYLSYQSISTGSFQFEIPFNRQQLADYLGVDRSAMSNELSKMQKEGILTFHKNSFHVSPDISLQ